MKTLQQIKKMTLAELEKSDNITLERVISSLKSNQDKRKTLLYEVIKNKDVVALNDMPQMWLSDLKQFPSNLPQNSYGIEDCAFVKKILSIYNFSLDDAQSNINAMLLGEKGIFKESLKNEQNYLTTHYYFKDELEQALNSNYNNLILANSTPEIFALVNKKYNLSLDEHFLFAICQSDNFQLFTYILKEDKFSHLTSHTEMQKYGEFALLCNSLNVAHYLTQTKQFDMTYLFDNQTNTTDFYQFSSTKTFKYVLNQFEFQPKHIKLLASRVMKNSNKKGDEFEANLEKFKIIAQELGPELLLHLRKMSEKFKQINIDFHSFLTQYLDKSILNKKLKTDLPHSEERPKTIKI